MNREKDVKSGFGGNVFDAIRKKFLIFKVLEHQDSDSFGELYDLYLPQIYRFVYFKVLRKEEAEDLSAQTFFKAWEYLKSASAQGKTIDNFDALIYTIARNTVIDFYRKRAKDGKPADLSEGERIEAEESGIQSEIFQGSFGELEGALRQLKDLHREVIVLRFLEERNISEIAEITGKTSSHVRVILHRGLQALKQILIHENSRAHEKSKIPEGNLPVQGLAV